MESTERALGLAFFTLYTIADAAEALGYSEYQVRRMIRQGRLKACKRKKPGRFPYYVIAGWMLAAYQDARAAEIIQSFLDAAKAEEAREPEGRLLEPVATPILDGQKAHSVRVT